jgi:hypothetical protein
MALGYTVGAILKRSSLVLTDEQGMVTVKFDTVADLSPSPFVQVQGNEQVFFKAFGDPRVVSKRSAESITTTVPQPAVPQLEYRLGHDGSATMLALLT